MDGGIEYKVDFLAQNGGRVVKRLCSCIMLNNVMSTSIKHSQLRGLKELYEILSLFPGSVMKTNYFGISPSGLAPTFFGGEVELIRDFSNVKNTKFTRRHWKITSLLHPYLVIGMSWWSVCPHKLIKYIKKTGLFSGVVAVVNEIRFPSCWGAIFYSTQMAYV